MAEREFRMVAQTLAGLEDVLRTELLKLGARDLERHNRAVSFRGDLGFLYKANFCLRTALRVLVPIDEFNVRSPEDLYRGISRIAWEDFIALDGTFAIRCTLNTPHLAHAQFAAQKAKDAIADRFREKFKRRPDVDTEDPAVWIHLHVSGDTCVVSLDSSGGSLHQRGYRDGTNRAPLNEVLAAGMVLLSGWDRARPLVDPMCGSGTILTEAGLIAGNVPPGWFRPRFGFQRWNDFDAELWTTIQDAAIAKITGETPVILGGEISRNTARKALANIHNAKLEDVITVRTTAFADLEAPEQPGVLIMNPPYGERMDEDEDINALYKMIGDTLKKNWTGWEAWVLTSNLEAAKHIKLTPRPRIRLFNGALDCRFLRYELYAGSRRLTPAPAPGTTEA